uniref:RRM domain-containing protein n=1 Tax=Leptocylindrus danicus TaxID=163516 RepID=A0A7S2LDR4_9STRA|mmetsp:Transcript_3516/g.5106  ORF Transcript_3516/g.5106 Transcript_3516/m.5106 type:complete len:142 (+) Transcript_3516:1-426(+)
MIFSLEIIIARRLFMQLTMNKMVAGVRYNIIGPEDASRTIHGCATLLGLELVDDLPETTIIITGMPKTIDTDHLINVFKEYGEISDAAMASRMRGFGLVRYRWSKSVKQVMETHRNDEIVVQDVAVTVRVLRPDKNKNDEL